MCLKTRPLDRFHFAATSAVRGNECPPFGSRTISLHGSLGGDRQKAFVELYRIPGEDVAGTLERRERRPQRALELLADAVGRPAVGAMDRTDYARLAEQENLVLAYAGHLAADA